VFPFGRVNLLSSGSKPVSVNVGRLGMRDSLKGFMNSLVAEGVEVRMKEGDGFLYIESTSTIYGLSEEDLAKVDSGKRKKIVPGFEPKASLFIEDDSLHFDYGHALPGSKTCSVLHGHSSRVSAEIFGQVGPSGMIIDFGEAKSAIKETLGLVDHKFIIGRKYVVDRSAKSIHVKFEGPNGAFDLRMPPSQVVVLDAEATSENIAKFLAGKLLAALPRGVDAVKLFFFEGVNKGASYFRVMAH
jgi:6-pyruvoyltetrahydropterin/6-carboxytetrahydropterin synthase